MRYQKGIGSRGTVPRQLIDLPAAPLSPIRSFLSFKKCQYKLFRSLNTASKLIIPSLKKLLKTNCVQTYRLRVGTDFLGNLGLRGRRRVRGRRNFTVVRILRRAVPNGPLTTYNGGKKGRKKKDYQYCWNERSSVLAGSVRLTISWKQFGDFTTARNSFVRFKEIPSSKFHHVNSWVNIFSS